MDRVRRRLVRSRLRRAPRGVAVFFVGAAWFLLAGSAWPREAAGAESSERITLDEWGVVIEFRAADRKVASEVASICRKSLPPLSRELGLAAVEPFHVFLLSDVKAYEERMGFSLPSWGVAFAFPGNNIVLVDVPRATKAWDTLDKVIPHELSHLLLGQRTGDVRFPLWFMEGLAQWQAGEWSVMESWRLTEAVWGNRAPALGRVVSYMPADENLARDAYRVSYEAFQYRFDEHTERLGDFLEEVVKRGDFGEAFAGFWNETEGQFYARFDEHLARKYSSPLMLFQTGPLFTLASVLFVIVAIRIWIRNRRKLQRMEAAERGGPPGPE
jgi:hypothetical protein